MCSPFIRFDFAIPCAARCGDVCARPRTAWRCGTPRGSRHGIALGTFGGTLWRSSLWSSSTLRSSPSGRGALAARPQHVHSWRTCLPAQVSDLPHPPQRARGALFRVQWLDGRVNQRGPGGAVPVVAGRAAHSASLHHHCAGGALGGLHLPHAGTISFFALPVARVSLPHCFLRQGWPSKRAKRTRGFSVTASTTTMAGAGCVRSGTSSW